MAKPASEALPKRTGADYRSLGPVHCCPCGQDLFLVLARFHERQVALYYTDAQCADCGALVKVPTEADVED